MRIHELTFRQVYKLTMARVTCRDTAARDMATTRAFKSGNSQANRAPAPTTKAEFVDALWLSLAHWTD